MPSTPSKPDPKPTHPEPKHPDPHHETPPKSQPGHEPPRQPYQPPGPAPKPPAARHEALPIGARPDDPHDPQSEKFEARPAPPRWDEEPVEAEEAHDWTPKAAIDPRAERPPEHAYVDGMTIADEQRARAAWVEAHGLRAYNEEIDPRPEAERPVFDKDAITGGAFVSPSTMKQVPGVTPPTKRS